MQQARFEAGLEVLQLSDEPSVAAPRAKSQERECAAMPVRGILISLAVNFVVAGAAWYFRGPNAGLICLAIGGLLLILGLLWPKKKKPPPPPSQTIIQTQEFNPQFNAQFNPTIQIGVTDARSALSEQEKLGRENAILDFMRQQRERQPDHTLTYLVEGIASATNLTMRQAAEALESLYLKKLLFRSTIEAPGDFVYWFSDLEN